MSTWELIMLFPSPFYIYRNILQQTFKNYLIKETFFLLILKRQHTNASFLVFHYLALFNLIYLYIILFTYHHLTCLPSFLLLFIPLYFFFCLFLSLEHFFSAISSSAPRTVPDIKWTFNKYFWKNARMYVWMPMKNAYLWPPHTRSIEPVFRFEVKESPL